MGWSVSHIPWLSCYFSGTGQGKEFSLECEGEPTALLCSLGGRPGLFACACPALTRCSECGCGVWNIYHSWMWFCDRNCLFHSSLFVFATCSYFWTCLRSAETNFQVVIQIFWSSSPPLYFSAAFLLRPWPGFSRTNTPCASCPDFMQTLVPFFT